LPANASGNYCCLYSPFNIGEKKGSISIFNKNFGEIWYDLKLTGLKTLPQKLPLFKAELGKFTSIDIILENPSHFFVEAESENSNTLNFEIVP
jgi:hypothetical protein